MGRTAALLLCGMALAAWSDGKADGPVDPAIKQEQSRTLLGAPLWSFGILGLILLAALALLLLRGRFVVHGSPYDDREVGMGGGCRGG